MMEQLTGDWHSDQNKIDRAIEESYSIFPNNDIARMHSNPSSLSVIVKEKFSYKHWWSIFRSRVGSLEQGSGQ